MEERKTDATREARLDKLMKEISETPKRMWMLYSGLMSRHMREWKKGPKTDRIRINRVRSMNPRYNETLDIPEIFDRIVMYLDADDPADAINFCRAIETLGCLRNIEAIYLLSRRDRYKFTDRVSLGLMRTKLLKHTHCTDCRDTGAWLWKPTIISKQPYTPNQKGKGLCWFCLRKRYTLMTHKVASAYLMKRNRMTEPQSYEYLDCPKHSIPRIKYGNKFYYFKSDLREIRKKVLDDFLEDMAKVDDMSDNDDDGSEQEEGDRIETISCMMPVTEDEIKKQ